MNRDGGGGDGGRAYQKGDGEGMGEGGGLEGLCRRLDEVYSE